MIQLGAVIAGKYQIDGVVGAGGMGIVVAARHLELDRAVCLKFMSPRLAEDSAARKRFVREARIASALHGEHVCRVSDVATLDDGTPYIVMERVDGKDLAAEVAHRGPFAISEALELLVQVCHAVGEAHALGVVHRDLKPHNLLLSRRVDGTPLIKVVDFGISKRLDEDGGTTGALGSPSFMAPEQALRGRIVDARSDVYSLGALLYFLVTGRPPLVADDPLALLVMLQTDQPAPLSTLSPSASPALDALVARCLDKRPERRYANAIELGAALSATAGSSHAPRGVRRTRLARTGIVAMLASVIATIAVGASRRAPSPASPIDPPVIIEAAPASLPPAEAPKLDEVRAPVALEAAAPAVIVPATRPRAKPRQAVARDPQPLASLPPSAPHEPLATVAPGAEAPTVAIKRCKTDDFLCQFGPR